MTGTFTPKVREVSSGLWSRLGPSDPMSYLHRHEHVELTIVWDGWARYQFGGAQVLLTEDRLGVFWASIPHSVIDRAKGTQNCTFRVPTSWFIEMDFPPVLSKSILDSHFLIDHPRRFPCSDCDLLTHWHHDLSSGDQESTQIMLIEMRARLGRFAQDLAKHGPAQDVDSQALPQPHGSNSAHRMARYISEHYCEPMLIPEVAESVGLDPSYATRLFKTTFGMTPKDYLMHQRVAHAQRMLMNLKHKMLDIAMDSGFGSPSRFYESFKRVVGQTPRDYRREFYRAKEE